MLHLGSAHDNVLKGSDLSYNPLRRKWNKNNSKIKKKNCCPQFPKRPVSCIQRFLRSSKHLRLFTTKLFRPRAHGRFWKFPAASAAFECCNVVRDHQSHLISRHPSSRCAAAPGSPEPSQGHLWESRSRKSRPSTNLLQFF